MPVICEFRACHHDGEGAVATMPSGRDRRDPPECLALWWEGRKSLRPCADLTGKKNQL